MGHPTTKKIKLGEFDHANHISILREEYGGFFRNGRAWTHRRVSGVAQEKGMSKKTIFVEAAGLRAASFF